MKILQVLKNKLRKMPNSKLHCENRIAQRKPELKQVFDKIASRLSVMPQEALATCGIENYLHEAKAVAESLTQEVTKTISIPVEQMAVNIDRIDTSEKSGELTADIQAKTNAVNFKTGELLIGENTDEQKVKKYKRIIRPVKGLLTMLDTILFAGALTLTGMTTLSAYASSIGIGIGFYFYTTHIVMKIKKVANSNWKIELPLFIVALAVPSYIFFRFAILRADMLKATLELEGVNFDLSPITFVILNVFLVFCAMILTRVYRPEQHILEQSEKNKSERKAIQKEQKNIQTLQDEKSNLQPNLRSKTLGRYARICRAKEVVADVHNEYRTQWEQAKGMILARTQGSAAEALSKVRLPPLERNPYEEVNKRESKTYFFIPFLIFIFLSACTSNTAPTKAVLIYDFSDKLLAQEQIGNINKQDFQRVFLPKETIAGHEFEQVSVTDKMYGEAIQKISLIAKKSIVNGSDWTRRAEKAVFVKKGVKLLHSLQSKPTGESRTLLLFQVHKVLNGIQQSDIKSARIVVCSDWLEHSETLNLYDPKTLKKLQEHPAELYKLIDQEFPLQKITKPIEIIFLFRSSTTKEDTLFHIVSGLRKYYESKNIEVQITTNLQNINQL